MDVRLTRRDVMKAGAAAAATVALRAPGAARASEPPADPKRVLESRGAVHAQRARLDDGWRFALGHADDPAKDFGFGALTRERTYAKTGAGIPPSQHDFDDSAWRGVRLPHDWAVELPFIPGDLNADGGGKPIGRDHPATSVGWYRRTFDVAAAALEGRVFLEFDGVFRDALVAVNGIYVGENFSGYAPFVFDVSDFLKAGRNVVAVRVDATLGEGWFYEGAGIYRHVWLRTSGALHVAPWGKAIRSTIAGTSARVEVDVECVNGGRNEKTGFAITELFDPEGRLVATARSRTATLKPWESATLRGEAVIADASLWSLERPALYRARTRLFDGGTESDSATSSFGIRSIRFDPDRGFFLNDRPVKIKGTCNHQDHAGVGVALPDRLQSFRVEQLKAMGSNAYRTSHNAPAPELVDACDALGMLVMCETRMFSSSDEGLSQVERMVRSMRNHPSIVLWSLGNEEPLQGTPTGERIAAAMKARVQELDPTRPVTLAMNGGWGKGASHVVDVQGCNYNLDDIDTFHRTFPKKPMFASEIASTVSTRGIYVDDKVRGYVNAYGTDRPHWGQTPGEWWQFVAERPFFAGGFSWTGFDYRGEPTPYGWPCISSHFGIMDTCGIPKDIYYYYQAWWSDRPVLHLLPHWNWHGQEGQPIEVWCFTNAERVELFLNDASLGAQSVPHNGHVAWKVLYAPGTLVARAVIGRKDVSAIVKTTGGAAAVNLAPDRSRIAADGDDVSVVFATIADAQGTTVPVADNLVRFEVSGPGRIIGVGNGDPSSHEPDAAQQRAAFNGFCMALVQSTGTPGEIVVTATSNALKSATTTLSAS